MTDEAASLRPAFPSYERFYRPGKQIAGHRTRMLRSKIVSSVPLNPSKSTPSSTGPVLQWLQSTTADVWVKFLLSLLGLGLAFGAALFSTVSRDAGNLWN